MITDVLLLYPACIRL